MYISGFVAATTPNVLSGSIFEFLKRPSRVNIGVYSDVAINAGNTFTFQIGDTVIANAAVIFGGALTTSGQADHLRFPDDYVIQNEPGLAGDRMVLEITRAAGNLLWAVMITEVG